MGEGSAEQGQVRKVGRSRFTERGQQNILKRQSLASSPPVFSMLYPLEISVSVI